MENVDHICEAFLRSLPESTVQASMELRIPHLTLWKLLRKRVKLKPYSTSGHYQSYCFYLKQRFGE
jgi:hypothetical protein